VKGAREPCAHSFKYSRGSSLLISRSLFVPQTFTLITLFCTLQFLLSVCLSRRHQEADFLHTLLLNATVCRSVAVQHVIRSPKHTRCNYDHSTRDKTIKMKYNTIALALGALAMGVSAQGVAPEVQSSVLMEIAQAIPSDQVAYAIASSSAFAAEMASSLAAGNTPAWYQALPTDVQSLLPEIYPAMVTPTPTPTPTPSSSSSAYVAKSSSVVETSSSAMVTPYPTGSNSTMAMPTMSATGSVTVSLSPSPSGSASPSPETPPFEGAASKMSVGAGLGAAVMLAMLAL